MLKVLRKYVDDIYTITEYTRDGVTVNNVTKTITPLEQDEPVEPVETLEQKLERLERQIQQDSLLQLEVLATIYEELLMKG